MANLKFAVFGTGWWSHFQIPAWFEVGGVELVALYNRTVSKAEKMAETLRRLYKQVRQRDLTVTDSSQMLRGVRDTRGYGAGSGRSVGLLARLWQFLTVRSRDARAVGLHAQLAFTAP